MGQRGYPDPPARPRPPPGPGPAAPAPPADAGLPPLRCAATDTPPVKYQGTLPVEKRDDNDYTIAFQNVSFRYPGAEDWALKDFSIRLRVGERLAVVGLNGSGKTTFIKLLCRLYDPQEGVITLNGIDIKKYDYEEYMTEALRQMDESVGEQEAEKCG